MIAKILRRPKSTSSADYLHLTISLRYAPPFLRTDGLVNVGGSHQSARHLDRRNIRAFLPKSLYQQVSLRTHPLQHPIPPCQTTGGCKCCCLLGPHKGYAIHLHKQGAQSAILVGNTTKVLAKHATQQPRSLQCGAAMQEGVQLLPHVQRGEELGRRQPQQGPPGHERRCSPCQ